MWSWRQGELPTEGKQLLLGLLTLRQDDECAPNPYGYISQMKYQKMRVVWRIFVFFCFCFWHNLRFFFGVGGGFFLMWMFQLTIELPEGNSKSFIILFMFVFKNSQFFGFVLGWRNANQCARKTPPFVLDGIKDGFVPVPFQDALHWQLTFSCVPCVFGTILRIWLLFAFVSSPRGATQSTPAFFSSFSSKIWLRHFSFLMPSQYQGKGIHFPRPT